MDERPTKRRGPMTWLAARTRRFWIILAVMPMLYFASIGPWVWIGWNLPHSLQFWHGLLNEAYCAPLDFVWVHAPKPIQRSMEDYVKFFMKPKPPDPYSR